MAVLNSFRHEFKYFCSSQDIEILNSRFNQLLNIDTHANSSGYYTIRSLYFDTYDSDCFFENENGTDPREKFRIRIYNADSSRISLECKRKEKGKTLKTSILLSQNEYDLIIENKMPFENCKTPLLKKLVLKMQTELMRPVVIVEYDRIPYIWKDGNVRITFDKNIRASSEINRFFDNDLSFRPILSKGIHLMEFKYDEFYPKFIKEILNNSSFPQTTFSKYYLCRKFLDGGFIYEF